MARRAVASADKIARRDEILNAAGALFMAGDGSLPAAAEIAHAAGLAKGTVYLYFRTKEEIFVTLLLEGWSAVMDDAEAALAGSYGDRSEKTAAFIDAYVRQVHRRHDLMKLDALGYAVLDRNLDPGILRATRLASIHRVVRAGGALECALELPENRGIQLLTRTYAMTRGLWQALHGCEGPLELAEDFTIAQPDFAEELHAALTEYWRGALGEQ